MRGQLLKRALRIDSSEDTLSDDTRPAEFVQSLERGFQVIPAFDAEHTRLTLSDVARETGMSRAAARRFLLTLVELGYVGTDGRACFLRPRLLELGYACLSGLDLPAIAHPHLQHLSDTMRESSSIAVLDGDDIACIARVAVRRLMTVAIGVGTRLPAATTSMGRVLLAALSEAELDAFLAGVTLEQLTPATITDKAQVRAELDRVAAQGWALVDQELETGLRSMAVPIRDAHGQVVAALNMATPAARERNDEDYVIALTRAAAGIEADLHRAGGGIT